MYLCYVDESGVPQIPGNTSHYILAGIMVPDVDWKKIDYLIEKIKARYGLTGKELHTAWLMRSYSEQRKIANFDSLDYEKRRIEVNKYRKADLLKRQQSNPRSYRQAKKNYSKSEDYIHLTYEERKTFVFDVAKLIGGWSDARLFAECIDKIYFDPAYSNLTVDEQAFEQVISRYEQYLQILSAVRGTSELGMIIHDSNQTSCKRHTEMMKEFHSKGTLWTKIKNIIETPLFVDSSLTSLVQVADLCGFALRRYLENQEEGLFAEIFKRADKKGDKVVGVRHFTNKSCRCIICQSHS